VQPGRALLVLEPWALPPSRLPLKLPVPWALPVLFQQPPQPPLPPLLNWQALVAQDWEASLVALVLIL
jgi:hypothetical protein